jgi:hypothetical protein
MGTSASVLDIVRGGNGGQAMEAPRAAPADPNRLRSLVERVVRLETERRRVDGVDAP